jgi:hypothetical protein
LTLFNINFDRKFKRILNPVIDLTHTFLYMPQTRTWISNVTQAYRDFHYNLTNPAAGPDEQARSHDRLIKEPEGMALLLKQEIKTGFTD